MRERDVDSRQAQELRSLAKLRSFLLVGSNLRAVVLNLRGGGDEGDQKVEPLPECGDIVVDLEEQVVLDFLGETHTEVPVISSQQGQVSSS